MAVVTIEQGKLRGRDAVSEEGNKYFEFLSVPYAKPPVGELRFKRPQAPEAWEGERDGTTTSLSNMSCHKNFMTGEVVGSEDCLYLNIYTPQLSSSSKLPVMVYIHGGGFIFGTGIVKEESNPELLVDNGVVVVSINYRLGVLGFLSLDIPEASGNMGLKDQVKALEWIQKNIEKFGGDKDNVTIFGISAGSASVEYLMLSPMARGLFHKAILQSGSTLNDWALSFEYEKLVSNLADKLGYNGDKNDKKALCDFLLEVPETELTDAAFFVLENFTQKSLYFGFVPVVEKIEEGAFLTSKPYKLLKEGKFARVPVMRGFCEKEGLVMSGMKPHAVNSLLEHKRFVDFWSFELDSEDKEDFNRKLTDAYLKAVQPDDEKDAFAVDFFGDLHFAAGVWIASKFFAKHGLTEYVYRFTYDGQLNAFKKMFGLMKKGTAHGDDIGYVFKTILFSTQPTETDIAVRSNFAKMWTDFAKTGTPTPRGSPVEWPTFTEQSKSYANINKDLSVESNYAPEKMDVFEEIYRKYEK